MSRQPTEAEAAALAAMGYTVDDHWVTTAVLEAYRAGFRDGSKPPKPTVFCLGAPEPGPDIKAVIDRFDTVWSRGRGVWSCMGTHAWSALLGRYGAVVACKLPDHYAVLDAYIKRRAAEQAAGGAQ